MAQNYHFCLFIYKIENCFFTRYKSCITNHVTCIIKRRVKPCTDEHPFVFNIKIFKGKALFHMFFPFTNFSFVFFIFLVFYFLTALILPNQSYDGCTPIHYHTNQPLSPNFRSEEHTSELQSQFHLFFPLLLLK